ncbi:YqaJ viral recombinase family nuclease [Sphingobium sp. YC-XJ3]|uniref:YqaJ viral recombinase family nuclease n=1 Tax=Sphingobium sp. YC-XJ3 TaxID=3024245 RepID=UPI00235F1317|nr:YqaJ viral recombinase family protein [Sphingobium sp. YC-XJ3]WDA36436.1 YqaJ viral recombinase family protein [Sphingobium sp. YC-XJ3]
MKAVSPILAGDGDDAFRSSVVGASEVAALFDAHPWLTHFELWHRKNGTVATPDFSGNERTEWGVRLEPVIIEAACERFGYEPLETPKRLDNGKGLGGHPDKLVMCPRRGRGILEVKTADWLVAKGWGDEPPLNYLLQIMTYMGLAGCDWGDVIVLVGGNELRRFEYQFRPVIYADIEARSAAFWRSIEEGRAPSADYTRDLPTISALYPDASDAVADLRTDNLACDAAARWLTGKVLEKQGKAQADAAQAELLDKMGEAGVALLDGMTVKCPTVKATPDRIISAEDIGTTIKGRKSYRRFSIVEKQT